MLTRPYTRILSAILIVAVGVVLLPHTIYADSPGARARDWWSPDEPAPEQHRIRVVDAETGAPVHDATVYAGTSVHKTSVAGETVVSDTVAHVLVTAAYYQPAAASASTTEIALEPAGARLRVRDAESGEPLRGATITVNDGWARTDVNGYAPLPDRVTTQVVVKHGGYRTKKLDSVPEDRKIALEPFVAQGIYLSFNWLDRGRDRLVAILDEARSVGINTIVIDAKGDRGFLGWESDHPDAKQNEVNGVGELSVKDVLELAKERDFYVIARVVVFKDNPLAFAQPQRAVRRADGSVWIDGEELGWANPLRPANWEYNAALARELAEIGFDEVNLDYIRFPTDGDIGAIQWERDLDEGIRVRTINAFLRRMEAAVRPTPALLSGDVFGLVPTVYTSDMGIGQVVEEMAPHLDLFCPMTYPATYWPGNMDVEDPLRQPYDTVYRAAVEAVKRSDAPVRPWLQGYSWAGVDYGPQRLDAQVRGAIDAGSVGWIFWQAGGKYEPLFTYMRNR